jgi:[acyl-carrier-protein] S-malonyltransferase
MSYEAALLWVHERGLAMEEEGRRNPGKMAAILGMRDVIVESIAGANRAHVANYNIPDQQAVISGGIEEVDSASEEAAREGARKVVPLEVTVPAHTPLLEGAVERVTGVVNGLDISDPLTPIAANTARIIHKAAELRVLLPGQLTLPVRFGESIKQLREKGVTHFREFGHGDVLSAMVRRQFRGEEIITQHAKDDLE